MRLRLGFAVAAHLEPEVLLIDEVLAVGDAGFQRKCLGKMEDVTSEGRTVLFVSHNMGAITQLCERAVWLERGRVELSGPSVEVVEAYLSSGMEVQDAVWFSTSPTVPDAQARLHSARLLSMDSQPTTVVDFDTPFKVEIAYDVVAPVRDLTVTYHLLDSHGNVVFESMDTDLPEWKGRDRELGRYLGTCHVPGCLLKPGRYYLSLYAFIEYIKIIEHQDRVLSFDVSEVGYTLNPGRRGIVSPVLHWQVSRLDRDQPPSTHIKSDVKRAIPVGQGTD
jgi:lipopolysaccharide transport system ATP-binding protein